MTYKDYGKDFQKRDSASRFMMPFVYATDFRSDKRFARYVSKVKAICDKAIQNNFYDDFGLEYEGDTYKFIEDDIRREAEHHFMMQKIKNIENDDEESAQFIDNLEEKLEEIRRELEDEEDYDDEFDDDLDDEDDEFYELDDDEAKFLFKMHMKNLGVDDDSDVVDDIQDNFSFLNEYEIKDTKLDSLWSDIFEMFAYYDILMDIKAGRFIGRRSEEESQLLGTEVPSM